MVKSINGSVRKLGRIPEEGPSFRVETSCSTKTIAGKRRNLLLNVLNLLWPPCVMNIEVCMDWFYGIYKPANQIYGDLQTSRISMGSNGRDKYKPL